MGGVVVAREGSGARWRQKGGGAYGRWGRTRGGGRVPDRWEGEKVCDGRARGGAEAGGGRGVGAGGCEAGAITVGGEDAREDRRRQRGARVWG